jgi:hypothetical protein
MAEIILRFVQGEQWESLAIEWREAVAMPITPSHVECVTPAGKYLGQHASGGMLAREPGYDAGTFAAEFFWHLPVEQEQTDAFYEYMESSIGEPYDWQAIAGFVMPSNLMHLHLKFHAICSAKVGLGLRHKDCVFRWPVAAPWHLVDPRDLMLMLSAIYPIPL